MRRPDSLGARLAGYKVVREPLGLSPAEVYRCDSPDDILYLKGISDAYAGTTYSVTRERDALLWLRGRLRVPEVLDFARGDGWSWLLMGELPGTPIDSFANKPEEYVALLAAGIRLVQAVEIADCPLDSRLNTRLQELRYLLDHGLADTDPAHWEADTGFADPEALYSWLLENRPVEDPVFTHGDFSANLLVEDGQPGFLDLARAGVADRWYDIAFCVRDIREYCPDYLDRFFRLLGLRPDWEKIRYHILLDELF